MRWENPRLVRLFNPCSKRRPAPGFARRVAVPCSLLAALFHCAARAAAGEEGGWPASVESALVQAGTNRMEVTRALERVSATRRPGMRFLVENMPASDLASLSAGFLLENVELAYRAFESAPWASSVPFEVFLNDVLPYAALNERRDAWRRRLNELCAPLIVGCRTPGAAAARLNEQIFALLKVRYSTERKRPDQSPSETIQSGIATCTGLSILLVDACRSVGVPARVAATPMWVNLRGNHTWVEVWDDGWHFTGAAEQDPKGLDRGWFVHDAAQAKKGVPEHALYASSFRKTGLKFPLPWARHVDWVHAVDVTERYAPGGTAPEAGVCRLLVSVLDRPAGRRVPARVVVEALEGPPQRWEGIARDEAADLRDLLPFQTARGKAYQVTVEGAGRRLSREVRVGTNAQEVVLFCLEERPSFVDPAMACYAPPAPSVRARTPLTGAEKRRLGRELAGFFGASPDAASKFAFSPGAERLLRRDEAGVKVLAWEIYRTLPRHASARQDFEERRARSGVHESVYTLKKVGQRPSRGWPLFIAMHGGGNAPKSVNDSQWAIMQRYYRDHPELGGYQYVALRAPNDTWNGFYDDYVYPLVANLVKQFGLFGDTDLNKVFLMGYSHGGYGAFAIGPKMPDRFAAIHASAAAPTDGETAAATLRNTLFTFMIGEKDTNYGRVDRCRAFDAAVQQLRGHRTDIYPVVMQYVPGHGHTGLPDRDKIVEMYGSVRNPVPRELSWSMTDGVVQSFFWIRVEQPAKGREISAECRDNRLVVSASDGIGPVQLLLDGRLVDFRKPVVFERGDERRTLRLKPSLRVLCETLQERGDPDLAFTARLSL